MKHFSSCRQEKELSDRKKTFSILNSGLIQILAWPVLLQIRLNARSKALNPPSVQKVFFPVGHPYFFLPAGKKTLRIMDIRLIAERIPGWDGCCAGDFFGQFVSKPL